MRNKSKETVADGEKTPVVEEANYSQNPNTDIRRIGPWVEKEKETVEIENENEVSAPSDGVPRAIDLEEGQTVASLDRSESAKSAHDPNIVSDDGEDGKYSRLTGIRLRGKEKMIHRILKTGMTLTWCPLFLSE